VLGATVYVAADTQMGAYDIPTNEVATCHPGTPTSESNHYTCQPGYYTNANFGSSLPPGTYYWWLTFWHTDSSTFQTSLQISGPLKFTVPAPVPPTGVSLDAPADGETVYPPVTLTVDAPAQAAVQVYVSDQADHQPDGSPLGLTDYSCGGQTGDAGSYSCTDATSDIDFVPGETYYWWAVVTVSGTSWIYGPRSFTVADTTVTGSGGGGSIGGSAGGGGSGLGGGGGGGAGGGVTKPPKRTRTMFDAPSLHPAARYTGKSIRQTRLSAASYKLSKVIRLPKTVDVACWSVADWRTVSGDNPMTDGGYSTLAFWSPLLPHWINLSPGICRGIETLVHHRPKYPNRYTADAVETVTHEMMHAIGVNRQRFGNQAEARAECYGMQLSIILAVELGVPYSYADKLSKYNLENYRDRPPNYQDPVHCREGGPWDVYPKTPSPPWHSFPR
jgi:hypothetical protein